MASQAHPIAKHEAESLPPDLADMPLLYEDDEEGDMGESNPHTLTDGILLYGIRAHLVSQPEYQVFSNLNLYYHPKDPRAYVSPDSMVVRPYRTLDADISSYRIGEDGPAPVLTAEILSRRSAQQRDLQEKATVYAMLGVPEYILVDVGGHFLPERLLLKRRQPDETFKNEQDADGGVTSELGFRLIIDSDGGLRVLDAVTGKLYVRPQEAEQRVREAEQRASSLAEENARLRRLLEKNQDQ